MNPLGILQNVGKALSYVPAPVLEAAGRVVSHALGAKVERNASKRIEALERAKANADRRDADRGR